MKLSSLETTPNPHCMKLNLDEAISERPITVKPGESRDDLPPSVFQLIQVEGVREAFLNEDFIAIIRQSQASWEPILSQVAQILGVSDHADTDLLSSSQSGVLSPETTEQGSQASELNSKEKIKNLGEVEIAVLYFRGIPTQVRVIGEQAQQRVAMPDRFNEAMQRVVEATGANYVMERHWQPYASRHGEPEAVANMVAEEVASLIDSEDLQRIEQEAKVGTSTKTATSVKQSSQLQQHLSSRDWKERLKAIQQLEINSDTFPAVVKALKDDRATIRRWASALLGASESEQAIPPLSEVILHDPSVIVRRTAGDALSDLGFSQGTPTMCQALADSSKLVRWRAARFLYEMGDERAITSLEMACNHESEFDVRLEIKAAIDRITRGEERQLPMWMRLSQSSNPSN